MLQSGHVDIAWIQAEGAKMGERDAVWRETEVPEAASRAVEGQTGEPRRREQHVVQGKREGGHARGPLCVVGDEGEGVEVEGGDDVGDVECAEVEMGEAWTRLGGDPAWPRDHARLVFVGLDVDALHTRERHAVELVEHALQRGRGEPTYVEAAPATGVPSERGDQQQQVPPSAGDPEPALPHRKRADGDRQRHVATVHQVPLHHRLRPPGRDAHVCPQARRVRDDALPASADTQPFPARIYARRAVKGGRVLEDGHQRFVGELVHERTLAGVHELVEGALDASGGGADHVEFVQKRRLPFLEAVELGPELGGFVHV